MANWCPRRRDVFAERAPARRRRRRRRGREELLDHEGRFIGPGDLDRACAFFWRPRGGPPRKWGAPFAASAPAGALPPGALAVGVVESFASFWSGALKDVIVFSLLIPVLMLRSFMAAHAEEEEDEVDQ